MLVSGIRKVVFIHVQKTGGETISGVLRENIPDIRPFGSKHDFAAKGIETLGDWDEYYKFAFVRNPWDRLVSWYSMIRDASIIPLHEANLDRRRRSHRRQARENKLWRYVLERGGTFSEFVRNCTNEIEVEEGAYYSFTYNQLDYLTDQTGKVIVDFIGKYEHFERDAMAVFDRLGIKVRSMPHENVSSHRHYSSYYTPETESIVRARFKKDVDYFGYRFEHVESERDRDVSGTLW